LGFQFRAADQLRTSVVFQHHNAPHVLFLGTGQQNKSSKQAHHVRFTPKSGNRELASICPLCATSCREQMQQMK
jgi:hypothetical protein